MDEYVKVLIYPEARWLTPKEKGKIPSNKIPQMFKFADDTIHVLRTIVCERAVSRKVGGRGFRFVCQVNWDDNAKAKIKESIIWYDDFYDEWFVEIRKDWAVSKGMEYQEFDYTALR